MSGQPIWTDDALNRLLGASDGYIKSILAIRGRIHRYHSQYTGNFDPRHVRKIAQRDAITKPLSEVADILEADLRRCQEAYQREYARAHPVNGVVASSPKPSAPASSTHVQRLPE